MKAGALRHRITLEHNVTTRDEWGGEVVGWQTFAADVPAEVVPLSGREFIAAGELQGQVQARITIRYLPGVLDTMRIQFDGAMYAIRAVLPDPTGRRHLTLMVDKGVASG